jgi:SagB-type dehydrogenase family enzyme
MFRRILPVVLALGHLSLATAGPAVAQRETGATNPKPLPEPRLDGPVSVEQALSQRRSIRRYATASLQLADLGQLMWAAQGVTQPVEEPPPGFSWEWRGGMRTAPSAGALYPLELYAVIGDVEELEPGVYLYMPVEHALARVARPDPPPASAPDDRREALSGAALRQLAIRNAPAVLVLAGVVERTAEKYGDRAERYVHIEVGAAAQNVYLECESLELGTVFIGAFDDEAVAGVLGLSGDERVYGMMPIGHPTTD